MAYLGAGGLAQQLLMKKILIIDDEPYIAEIIKLFASKLGYEADASFSGEAVLRKAKEGEYWAVFCDLLMPGMNGLEIYEQIKDTRFELSRRFVLLTASIPDKKTENFLKEKEVIFFRKPFNFDNFKELFKSLEHIS